MQFVQKQLICNFLGAGAARKSLPSTDFRLWPTATNLSSIIHSGNLQSFQPPRLFFMFTPQLCHGNLCLESLRFKYRSELDSRCYHESFRWINLKRKRLKKGETHFFIFPPFFWSFGQDIFIPYFLQLAHVNCNVLMIRMFCCDVVFQDLSKCHMGLGILDLLQFLFTRFSWCCSEDYLLICYLFQWKTITLTNLDFDKKNHRSLASVDVEVRGSFMADFICRSFLLSSIIKIDFSLIMITIMMMMMMIKALTFAFTASTTRTLPRVWQVSVQIWEFSPRKLL